MFPACWNPNPASGDERRSGAGVNHEDLPAIEDAIRQGQWERQWTEREAAARKALTGAFEREVRREGHRSTAESQRAPVAGR